MKKNQHGGIWRKLDNTGKIFPVITNEKLSNVFRVSVLLKEEVDPEPLQQALEEVLPQFDGFRVKLRRGFFWYYFEANKRKPVIEKENTYPCKYIDPHSNQLYLFRVSYYGKRINMEVFHAITDGMGAVSFLRELTYRYLQLVRGTGEAAEIPPSHEQDTEDSYLKNYKKKIPRKKYSSVAAYHLSGELLPLDAENIIHGYVDLPCLKKVSKSYGVSITKYLTAAIIWSIYQEYLDGRPCSQPIGVNLPINLRAIFDSDTMANFFAVTTINFLAEQEDYKFEDILELVNRQMDKNIVKEKLEETISYNVSNEKKWYIRIVPLFLKWAALNVIFRRNDRAHTVTVSNIGPIKIDPEYHEDIEQFYLTIGVSKRQNAKCGVCALGDQVVVTFSTVFNDTRLADSCFHYLRQQGMPVEVESNGAVDGKYDKGMYPKVSYDVNKWKTIVNVFYAVIFALAAILGLVNYATYNGHRWSAIAIACIIYTAVTVKYSVMRHANLAFKIVVQTLGVQALLVIVDYVSGYSGWSVDYAIPSTILFADIAVVFLIVVNRLNWQSYFMYQISITIFSFIPLILWAAGLISNPVMPIVTVIVTVLVLTLTVLMGDRSVKNELIKRFHL